MMSIIRWGVVLILEQCSVRICRTISHMHGLTSIKISINRTKCQPSRIYIQSSIWHKRPVEYMEVVATAIPSCWGHKRSCDVSMRPADRWTRDEITINTKAKASHSCSKNTPDPKPQHKAKIEYRQQHHERGRRLGGERWAPANNGWVEHVTVRWLPCGRYHSHSGVQRAVAYQLVFLVHDRVKNNTYYDTEMLRYNV